MKHRRRSLAVRHFIFGLLATIIGAVGSLAIAAPSQAAEPCEVTYYTSYLGQPEAPLYQVSASIKNTRAVTSTDWSVYILFAPEVATHLYWNVQPDPVYQYDGLYAGVAYNKAIAPGQSASFGFLVKTPPGVTSAPTVFSCYLE
jgi:endoglucanase